VRAPAIQPTLLAMADAGRVAVADGSIFRFPEGPFGICLHIPMADRIAAWWYANEADRGQLIIGSERVLLKRAGQYQDPRSDPR
jgi:hypothetical protein